jgi:transposase
LEFDGVTPCGRVLLWLGILRSLRLKELIDSRVRSECDVSHGTVIEALVLNRLISPRPLSRIAAWAEESGLFALTGLDSSKLNDDRLGRALDALAPAISGVQAELTTRAVQAFEVAVSDVNYDTTAMFLEGFYEDSELAARGHSKDRRPDHKQVNIALATSEDGQVPLTHVTLPGNTGDVTTVPTILVELRRQMPLESVVMSGDAAMWSQANMDEVARAGGTFLGPIAMNSSVQDWVRTTELTTRVQVQLVRTKEPVEYEGAIASRFPVNGVDGAGVRIVAYDGRRAREQREERGAALVRYETAIAELDAKLNAPRLKTKETIDKRLAALAKRHGLASRYVHVSTVDIQGHFELKVIRDEAALAKASAQDGRWPLVTNQRAMPDEELIAWAIQRYKRHGGVERDMHLLKGPLRVRPVFLHNDDRIRGLVAICAWALMALTLLERGAKKVLPDKPRLPLVARVESMFAAVAIVTYRLAGSSQVYRSITTLRGQHVVLLRTLRINVEVRELLGTGRAAEPPN